jgi:cystathionine beta-synthase
MARRITREEGLFVGGSTGLVVRVAVDVAHEVDDPEACIVCVLCDTGERYLSKLFNDEWMRENQLLETERVTATTLLASKTNGGALVTVGGGNTIRQALNLMETYNVSQLPVVESGDCVGAVSESMLMARAIADPGLLEHQIRELMEPPYPVVDSNLPLERFSALLSREIPAVLVRIDGEITGIVTRFDVLHHIQGVR